MGEPTVDVEEFATALVEMKLAYPHQLRGCGEDDVAQVVESANGFPLPEHYLAFLRRLGREAGRLLLGTTFFYPDVLRVPAATAEFIADAAPDLRTEGRFFFAMHQGYQFYFFDRDHPGEVFLYTEGDEEPVVVGATLIEYLWREAEGASAVSGLRLHGDRYPS
ncbi:SMI1/KNR4 family protein [Saccharothrix sp. S26]|uniref:SMI1/KNR4 family protein n=1 Tax=Saccharothrix sp. S26 TaxID=2907215 RepID=UPI001F261800|nr:SMI1/KNR4 family protein [Saccharothrix sp. S26]MCE6995050.1 SMI1/KNR4 family protein [Saccharothrix sp. S26]